MSTGYGSGEIYAKVGTDRMCMAPNDTCAPHHVIGSTIAQRGLMNLNSEGIIGLALSNTGDAISKLYLESLKEAGAIDKKMFAFLISFENHAKSKVTFGGIDLD